MICGAVMLCGSFYYFSKIGPGQSYDFEMAVLLFFLLTVFTRQMFERCAMMHRSGQWLTPSSGSFTCSGFTISSRKSFTSFRVRPLRGHGPILLLYLIAITKFSDMGAYLTGSFDWTSSDDSTHQPKEDLGRFFWRSRFLTPRQLGDVKLMPVHLSP